MTDTIIPENSGPAWLGFGSHVGLNAVCQMLCRLSPIHEPFGPLVVRGELSNKVYGIWKPLQPQKLPCVLGRVLPDTIYWGPFEL